MPLKSSLYRIRANGSVSSEHSGLKSELFLTASKRVGMGNISILLYIVILRAHDNRIAVADNYCRIIFTLLVVLLHKIWHALPEI